MRSILIHGIDSLLGSYFAARCLLMPDQQIFYHPDVAGLPLEDAVIDFVSHAMGQISEGASDAVERQKIEDRLHRIDGDSNVDISDQTVSTIDEVWYFADPRSSQSQVGLLKSLISHCPAIGAKEFNYVAFDQGGVKLAEEIPDQEIALRCRAANIEHRIFHTSLIAGDGHPRLAQGGCAFSRFLSVVHALKAEIQERSQEYFDFQSLRYFAPRDAALNLVPATVAVELLLRIARTNATTDSTFAITCPRNTPFLALCECIGIAYGIGLLAVQDFNKLNAIDRVLHEKSGDFHGYLIGGAPEPSDRDAYRIAGLPLDRAAFDEDAQITLFDSIRQSQDSALAEARQCAADLPGRLVNKIMDRNGSKLRYYVGGDAGTVVILLNALGQGLECWYRLIANLMENYRVIIWEPRGTVSPPPPFGLTDQLDDLDAIVQREGVESCHLVGWCTGPKVAIDFHLRRPSVVRSMAFLNATFKCKGSPEELDSPYECNIESLCRMLVRKPSMAASVRKTFQEPAEASEVATLQGTDAKQISVSVLTQMNADLKSHVLAPFRTDETTVNYAHQLIDFWSYDVRPKASEVRVPVLLMGTEYDQVATPASSQMAAGLFPDARHVHVHGATHYCLYDRPEFVAGLLKQFFENPEELPVARCVQNEVAHPQ